MNQEYRGRVKRHLEAGGDAKYVNVKGKAKARHASSHEKALGKKSGLGKLFSGKGLKFTEEIEKHKGDRFKFR